MHVLLLGDSLVAFNDWQSALAGVRILNYGRAGETVQGLHQRLANLLGDIGSVDAVMVMTGTNNVLAGDLFFLPVYENILNLLATRFADAPVMVVSLLPMRLPWNDPDAIVRFNELLRKLAAGNGCRYLDICGRFLRDDPEVCFLEDGVHLSRHGYALWEEALAAALGECRPIRNRK